MYLQELPNEIIINICQYLEPEKLMQIYKLTYNSAIIWLIGQYIQNKPAFIAGELIKGRYNEAIELCNPDDVNISTKIYIYKLTDNSGLLKDILGDRYNLIYAIDHDCVQLVDKFIDSFHYTIEMIENILVSIKKCRPEIIQKFMYLCPTLDHTNICINLIKKRISDVINHIKLIDVNWYTCLIHAKDYDDVHAMNICRSKIDNTLC